MTESTAMYLEKKVAQICTYHRCTSEPMASSQLCERHLAKQRKRDSKYRKQLRRTRRDAGLCTICRVVSKTYRCRVCQIRFAPVSSESVRVGVDNSRTDRSARIAAKTVTHADGRKRYHGQGKRGNQPVLQLDEQDLGYARRALAAGETGLQLYESPEVKELPRLQRDDVKRAALAQLARAQGHVEDVLLRRGGGDRDGARALQGQIDKLEERLAVVDPQYQGHTMKKHGRRAGGK